MKVRFFKPFDEICGQEEIRLDLNGPVEVKDLLEILEGKFPSLKPYLQKAGDEVLSFFVILIRGGEVLKMHDRVNEEDVIQILPPISGG